MNIFSIVVLSSVYISLFTFFLWVFILLDMKEIKQSKKKYSITFLIPTYNEEKNIGKTINSILNLNYKGKKKIIVVDDMSTDKTKEVVKKFKNVKFIEKGYHSGKVSSINMGLKYVNTDLFCVLDADTYFEKDAIDKLVGYFDNEKVGAVLAALKVENKRGIIPRLQVIEYFFSVFLRKIQSYYQGLMTTHGATLFRTSAIKEVGEFDENNPTEDMDIALRLIKKGYRIESDLSASAYTIVPNTFFKLLKQRIRWYGGFIYNSIIKHRDMLLKRKYFGLNYISYPLSYFYIVIAFLLVYGITKSIISKTIFYTKLFFNANILGYFLNSNPFFVNTLTMLSLLSLSVFLFLVYLMKGKLKERISIFSLALYIALFSIISSLFWVFSLPKVLVAKKGWKN